MRTSQLGQARELSERFDQIAIDVQRLMGSARE